MSFGALHSSLADECKLVAAPDHVEGTAGQCLWADRVAAYLIVDEGREDVVCLVRVVAEATPLAVKVHSWSVMFGDMMTVADLAEAFAAAVRKFVVIVVWRGLTKYGSRSLGYP